MAEEMDDRKSMHDITSVEALQRLYGEPTEASVRKVATSIHRVYRPFIDAARFVALATSGPHGLDVSPRGDPAGFVHVEDERTLLLPDRRGNNRIDSLRNVLHDPRVALLFLIPGVGETLRVNGRARILADPALLERFAMDGKLPRSILRIDVETVFFQCSRAVVRASLWDAQQHVPRSALPSGGQILSALSAGAMDGEQYDRELPARLKTTLY
jgi:PPOX class probable FMN-dependent enzyme